MKLTSNQVESYIAKIANQKIHGCLLYGPNESLARMRFQIIAKKIVKDVSDGFLVSNLSADKIKENKAILADEFFALSMLGGRKLIMIKDCDASTLLALKSMVSSKTYELENQNFILMNAGDLDKKSALRKFIEDSQYFVALQCYEDDLAIVKKFARERLEKNGISFEARLIDALIARFGKNRQILNSEIEKMVAYLGDEKSLNIEVFEKLSGLDSEDPAGDFVIDFANQKYVQSLVNAEKLLRMKEGEVSLIRFLITYFLKLHSAKTMIEVGGKSIEEAVKAQQLYFKIEGDFRRNLQALSLRSITDNLRRFEDCEVKIKSGNLSPTNAFLWSIIERINFLQQSKNLKKI